ncbi:MAG: ABC transporter permease subunit [Acetivibrionales bacterium]|jgi:ABC-2 type transport system permease protein
MNIFKHELKSGIRSAVSWTFSMILVSAVFLGVYPAFKESGEAVKKLMAGFPPEFLKALGFDVDLIFTPIGYYGLILNYIILLGAIQAMMLGISIISKEFTGKTADFLMTKPVSRLRIMTSKLLSGLVLLLATDAAAIGAIRIIIGLASGGPLNNKLYLMLSLVILFIALTFYVIGILAAAIFQRIKSVAGVSNGIVLGFFLLGMIGEAINAEKARYLVPFKYYDPVSIIANSAYDSKFVAINIAIVVACLAAGFVLFSKRDIRAV